MGKHRQRTAAEQLLRSIPEIALAQTRHRCIDRDNERGKPGGAGAGDRGSRHVMAADEIQLIPDRTAGRRPDIFHAAARQGGEHVAQARGTGGAGGSHFSAGMEQPAAADGAQHERQCELSAEHPRADAAGPGRDGTPRPEGHRVERPTILA